MAHKTVFDSDDEQFECLSPVETASQKVQGEEESSSDESLLVESDSDDAPDDIDFKVSKQTTLDKVKDAIKQIENEKKRVKEKRKQKDEMYKEQKKKKLEELEKKRLPDDFLKELSSRVKADPSVKVKATKHEEVDDRLSDSDDDEEEEEGSTEDFIPFDSVVKPVYIKAVSEASKTSAKNAADFRNQALYGNRLKREPVKEALAKKKKRKARFV